MKKLTLQLLKAIFIQKGVASCLLDPSWLQSVTYNQGCRVKKNSSVFRI